MFSGMDMRGGCGGRGGFGGRGFGGRGRGVGGPGRGCGGRGRGHAGMFMQPDFDIYFMEVNSNPWERDVPFEHPSHDHVEMSSEDWWRLMNLRMKRHGRGHHHPHHHPYHRHPAHTSTEETGCNETKAETSEQFKETVKVDKEKNTYGVDIVLGPDTKPNSLKISRKDNVLTIAVKTEKSSDDGSFHLCQEYTKKITLPENVDLSQLESALSPEGVLGIQAPLLPEPEENQEDVEDQLTKIPISILE